MFQPKKPTTMNSHDRPMCVQGDSGLVLTTDPKPRLRWTVELHERFVDAVTQLGGPDSHTKNNHESYGSEGPYTLPPQEPSPKFRLGKQPHKEINDHSMKDANFSFLPCFSGALDLQRSAASSSGMMARSMNEMQMEVQRRLHEQLEVQRHLQLRIEAQGMGNQGVPDIGAMKDFGPLNFPPFQDLNIYGGDQLDLPHNMDRPLLDGFISNNDNTCLGKKRPSPYSGSGKSPLIWSDDLRLQDLGTAPSCLGPQDDPFKTDQIQLAPPSTELDSISEIYDAKPVLSGDGIGEKKFEASPKLERPSPRRAALQTERMNPMINSGSVAQGRNSPFG
ncbi:hypothetical protein CXB51_034496 [Gossypium anomalum]|uniref:MYB-CC type transcription factor LHEQLE-containing domain-containing protein n=1 Tax=Gossypium anomalum TaxID=47600 RepID=A0A8J5Y1E7_9ROSI|nr:hypothetical protein CXB51_034496 [Gossypium anomalum]